MNYEDEAALREEAEEGRRLGFDGKVCPNARLSSITLKRDVASHTSQPDRYYTFRILAIPTRSVSHLFLFHASRRLILFINVDRNRPRITYQNRI